MNKLLLAFLYFFFFINTEGTLRMPMTYDNHFIPTLFALQRPNAVTSYFSCDDFWQPAKIQISTKWWYAIWRNNILYISLHNSVYIYANKTNFYKKCHASHDIHSILVIRALTQGVLFTLILLLFLFLSFVIPGWGALVPCIRKLRLEKTIPSKYLIFRPLPQSASS